MKKNILVCGSEGQLGKCLQDISKDINQNWTYTDIGDLDITNNEAVKMAFSKIKPDVVVNCSAYTAVDQAENDSETAYKVNANAVKILAEACNAIHAKFIHVSTDYVFDGSKNTPYYETDSVNPLNVYGESKLQGELYAMQANSEVLIIRTSWLYSEYGKNFAKTMVKLGYEKPQLQVIYDQTGTPTYAGDLAMIIRHITDVYFTHEKWIPGIYHFSNEGVCSWYDFAMNIMRIKKINCIIKPIPASQFPSVVKRPAYSVLSKNKIKETFDVNIPYWIDSLEKCLCKMQ